MLNAAGELEIVRDLLMHRVEQRTASIRAEKRAFTIRTQTRPMPFALDADDEDLHIRLAPADTGRLPGAEGLHHLRKTLPLVSDAIYSARAPRVQILGGAHLSIALALGAALPATKFGPIEAIDTRGATWSSEIHNDDPLKNAISIEEVGQDLGKGGDKLAIFATLTPAGDRTAFERLVSESAKDFTRAVVLTSTTTEIDPREAGRLGESIAQRIKQLAAESGRAEVHLAFHGPYTMAVLIGRHLNTVRTVVYEWENIDTPSYIPTLVLEPGCADGPITDVMLEMEDTKKQPAS